MGEKQVEELNLDISDRRLRVADDRSPGSLIDQLEAGQCTCRSAFAHLSPARQVTGRIPCVSADLPDRGWMVASRMTPPSSDYDRVKASRYIRTQPSNDRGSIGRISSAAW